MACYRDSFALHCILDTSIDERILYMSTIVLACNIVAYYQEITESVELTMAGTLNVLPAEITSAAHRSN
jgi:hypothetical protein